MAKYNRLSILEREELSRQLAAGYSLRKIAKSINRSPSTLSREIYRNVPDKKYYRGGVQGQGLTFDISHKVFEFVKCQALTLKLTSAAGSGFPSG